MFFWSFTHFLDFIYFIIFFLFLLFDVHAEVILSVILFPIKSPEGSAVFWTTLLEAVFASSIPVFYSHSLTTSSGLLFWSVNHTSLNENSTLVVFNTVNDWGAIVINCPNFLSGTNGNENFDTCW